MKTTPLPDMTPVKSSVATHAHYDGQTQALHVKFLNGKTFRYDGVPADKGETVLGAASFGQSLNRHILGKHPGKQVA